MLTAENYTSKRAMYFVNTHSLDTCWYGKGALNLGLSGKIESIKFTNLCNGLTPDGRSKLGSNTIRSALDCTFSVPKSVSLSALIGGDQNLVKAQRQSVLQTLSLVEKDYAQTRIRSKGMRYSIPTNNLIVALFDHIESRELDPHLHTHALIMNLTRIDSGKWYSLNNGDIYKNKKAIGLLYHRHLQNQVKKIRLSGNRGSTKRRSL